MKQSSTIASGAPSRYFSTLDSGLRDETPGRRGVADRTTHFSTLDSGLRDETDYGVSALHDHPHFSTLDSGLRDETTRYPATAWGETEISVPSTRVYAMKQDGGTTWIDVSGDFSTLDSGLRDETSRG